GPDMDSPTETLATPRTPDAVTGFLLWFGVLGGAIAWLVHLLGAYAVSEFGCASRFAEVRWLGFSGVAWLILGLSLLTLAVAIVAVAVARRHQRQFSGQVEAPRLEPSDPRVFLARTGVLSSA